MHLLRRASPLYREYKTILNHFFLFFFYRILKKSGFYRVVDFTVYADHRIEIKESEKIEEYLDIVTEQKKAMGHRSR